MAEENHHQIGLDELKAGMLVFFVLIFIIVFMSLYVRSYVVHSADIPDDIVTKNLTVSGKIYMRR